MIPWHIPGGRTRRHAAGLELKATSETRLRGRQGLSLIAWLYLFGAAAQEFDQGPVFSIIEENDLIVQTDRHYTQGIRFSYLLADNSLPGWLADFSAWLPDPGYDRRADKLGFTIGQNIYTPADWKARELLVNDRPYAGWLYGGVILQRRGLTGSRWPTLESLELDLGIIGPESLAHEAQAWIHELRGFDLFQGWNNQLETEPGLALKYLRAVRLSPEGPRPRHVDFIPHAGFSLGNTETSGRLGATLRLGYNLPNGFGAQTISSLAPLEGGRSASLKDRRWGFYAFTGAEGWAVAYTAFLDGNLFRDSHSIDKEPLVGEWKSGVVLVLNAVEVGVAYVFRTREFSFQKDEHRYGSLFVKVKL